MNQWTRREVLKKGGAFGLFASGLVVGGCGDGGDPRLAEPTGQLKELSYADSERFVNEFNELIKAGHKVRVNFDGTKKLGKDSELFKAMMNPLLVTNHDALAKSIRDMDTVEGRETLSGIFEPELLEHEKLAKPLNLPSGEVIEPGTVILVLYITLILASATYAVTQIVLGRKVQVVMIGPLAIQFEPA